MENIAIVDAGPLIALFDYSDKYHHRARRRLEKCRRDCQWRFMTTWPVITETAYILKERVHLNAQLDFLKWITLGGLEIFELTKDHLYRIIELQKEYTDLPMDFADATLVTTAESLNINRVFTLDKDFSIYRILGKRHRVEFSKRKIVKLEIPT